MKRRSIALLLSLLMLAGCQDSGDRVLVGKSLYSFDMAGPNRYDVVVFKYPAMPIENGSPKNYIKRLLGLPGELIAIFFGRLYSYHHEGPNVPEGISEEEWRKLTDTSEHSALDLWNKPPKNHETAQKLWEISQQAEKDGKRGQFQMLRKPPHVKLALSRMVYDNNHPAKDLEGVLPERWAPPVGSAWKSDDANGFAITAQGNSEQRLHYRHILRPSDWPAKNDGNAASTIKNIKSRQHTPQLITDFLGYNTYEVSLHGPLPPNWAGDLMLTCKLTVDEPKGEFWMELSRGVDRFQARFDLATGVCSLFRLSEHKTKATLNDGFKVMVPDWQLLATADTRVKAKGSYNLRFANYDESLTVWVGRDLPFGEGKEYPPPTRVGPDDKPFRAEAGLDAIENNDLQPASLCSVGAAVQVHDLQLWRDTYYTGFTENSMLVTDQSEVRGDDWGHPDKWDPIRTLPARTIYIYPNHYLCLGDNSQESSDSRQWGLVPQRLMLGRALLVYFPFERASKIK